MKRSLWIALGVAFALAAPSLFAKLYCDDQLFVTRLDGTFPAVKPGPFSLYTFANGGPENRSTFWWTAPGLHLQFMRPLASGLFALDHAIWGRAPLPYHAHSIAWYLAAVALASLLYRRLLPPRAGALASILFAVAPAHAMAANWPAARHVAIAGALSFASLFFHLRARERERPPVAALLCLALGLLASEVSLGAFAYVFAYEILGREQPPRTKARALLPYVALGAVYVVAYRALGFGARQSGNYADPTKEPLAFITNLPEHVGPLAASTFFGVPAEAAIVLPGLVGPMLALGAGATVAFFFLLRRAQRSMNAEDARTVRWLLAGALLACVPGMAGIVGDRVLFVPSLGLTGASAMVLTNAALPDAEQRRPLAARAGVYVLFFLQAVIAPLSLLGQTIAFTRSSREAASVVANAQISKRPDLHVFGVGIADPLIGMYLRPALAFADRPPVPVDLLSVSSRDHRLHRTADRALDIETLGGTLLENGFETVVRPKGSPLRVGDTVVRDAFTIRILEDIEGRPKRFSVTFDRSIDDPTLAIVVWQEGALRTLPPPRVGETVMLGHEVGPAGI